jgi:hypothetical protein
MSKEALIKTLNTFFNPVEYENVWRIPGQSRAQQAVTLGASKAIGIGTATALARTLLRKNQANRGEQLKSWAGARFPVVSADPSTRDTRRERKLTSAGVPKKIADVGELKIAKEEGTAMGAGAGKALDFIRQIGSGEFPVEEPALAMLGTAAGAYGGYRLADYIADARRKNQLSGDIEGKKNEIDKLIYKEYLRTRGLEKKAAEMEQKEAVGLARETHGTMQDKPGLLSAAARDPFRFSGRLAGAGLSAWTVLAATLAYKYSKEYHDKNDPARARMKQLQQVAKMRAKQKQAPLFLEGGDLPDIEHGAVSSARAVAPKPARISTTPGINTADPTDPLSSVLS